MDNNEISALSHGYWSGRAEEFSALRMADYETPMRERMETFIRGALPRKRPVKALDVGCGAGFLTLLLLNLGCSVTAVDFSAEMLAQAERNCRDKGYEDGAAFLQMDAQKLELPDESFDFVITRNVLWTLPDAASAYREMVRVLVPGGVLLNMDANYGRTFNEADARGETPTHPTQTEAQLRLRNRIARDLEVTKAERPAWDMRILWDAGVSEVRYLRDLEARLEIGQFNQASAAASAKRKSLLFAVIAVK